MRSLDREWRVWVHANSYRVQHMVVAPYLPHTQGYPRKVFKEIQRVKRTKNTYVEQEFDAAVHAMHRRRIQHIAALIKPVGEPIGGLDYLFESGTVEKHWFDLLAALITGAVDN